MSIVWIYRKSELNNKFEAEEKTRNCIFKLSILEAKSIIPESIQIMLKSILESICFL